MGLFKIGFIQQIERLVSELDSLDLSNINVSFEFNNKVQRIEELDVRCIELINILFNSGRISEKLKIALSRQLGNTLYKLHKLKPENSPELKLLITQIHNVLLIEMTAQRIGVEIKKPLYHGTGITGIKTFEVGADEFDYMGSNTLGQGIYLTTDKKMAVNYAFYRYKYYLKNKKQFNERIKPTTYKIILKHGKNYIADLSNPIRLRYLYKELSEYIAKIQPEIENKIISGVLFEFKQFLEQALKTNLVFRDIRELAGIGDPHAGGKASVNIQFLCNFLKSIGYSGLRAIEGGEPFDSVYPWRDSISYLIFDTNDVEISEEVTYENKNGKIAIINSDN